MKEESNSFPISDINPPADHRRLNYDAAISLKVLRAGLFFRQE